jgi:hypothetical protein
MSRKNNKDMSRIFRAGVLLPLLLLASLLLTACGDTPQAIAPYAGARTITVDQATQDSFKQGLKGIKEAKMATYAIKDDPAAVKSYYDSQYKDNGWTDRSKEIAEAATQQQAQNGWALAYEKGNEVVSLVLTPGAAAAVRFPEAQGDNVLVVISASK